MLLSSAEVTIGAITRRSYNHRGRPLKLSPLPPPSKVITGAKPSKAIIGADTSQSYHWCCYQLKLSLSSMPIPTKDHQHSRSPIPKLSLRQSYHRCLRPPELPSTPTPVRAIWHHMPCCYSTMPAMLQLRIVGYATTPPRPPRC